MALRHWAFFFFQVVIMYVFASAANVLHSVVPLLLWMVLALTLGLVWDRVNPDATKNGARTAESSGSVGFQAFLWLCGIAAAAIVALTDTSLWLRQGMMISLVGVQYYIPLGPFVLGAIVSTIYLWVLGLLKVRIRHSDLFVTVSLSILSLGLSYLLFIKHEGKIFKNGSGLEVAWQNVARKGDLFGPAPILLATPFIQLIGYIAGSWLVFWRESHVRKSLSS